IRNYLPNSCTAAQKVLSQLNENLDPCSQTLVENCSHGIRTDGTQVPLEVSWTPIKVKGSPSILICITDVSDRITAQQSIRNERDALSKVLELNTDGWWNWNLMDQNQLYMSTGFKRLFGYNDNELTNTLDSWKQIIYEEDRDEVIRQIQEHLTSDGTTPYYQRVRYKHKDGSTIWVICKGVALKNSEGNFNQMLGVHFDITKLIELEQNLRSANQKLQNRSEEMEQFIYTISHDLKSPLVTSQGFLGFLKEDLAEGNDLAVAESLKRLTAANARMSELIGDLLQLSRVGHQNVTFEKTDTQKIVQEIKATHQGEMLEDDEINILQLPEIICDKSKFAQAMENLISNAIRHSRIPGRPLKIDISADESATEFTFFVNDQGPGVDPKYHKKIFELFQRLKSSGTGTGVGLSIVKRVAELHDGQVGVKSNLGQGATFWISISKNCKV
ncbi:MAG: PAS domain-containing sensor histidine kinase, partial [Bdellovibrionales bacterium]|nr:PAS domain-containing sensor histidine kinase [Bdellovibrionales bacterium]